MTTPAGYSLRIFGREILRREPLALAAPPVAAPVKDPSGVLDADLGNFRSGWLRRKSATLDTGLRYASERAISNRFSALAYRVGAVKAGKFAPIEDHPALDLLRKPNPVMSGTYLNRLIARLVVGSGKCFVLVIRDGVGRPLWLWPLSAARVRVKWAKGGTGLEYEYGTGLGKPFVFSGSEVMYYRDVHETDVLGGSGAGNAAEMMAAVDAQLWDYEKDMFESGVFNTWTIGYPKEYAMSPEAAVALSRKWGERAKDKDRRQDPLIGTGGAEFKPFSVGNDVTSLAEVNDIVERRIRSIYSTPRGVLGDTDDLPRANLEGSWLVFNQMAIAPLCVVVDEERERVLLPMYDAKLRGEFENPVPGDREFELRERESMVRSQALTPNEWRGAAGMEPLEGGDVVVKPQTASVMIGGAPAGADEAAAVPVGDVAKTALNGAQVQALVEILGEVAAGRLSPEAAILAIMQAFPDFAEADVRKMVGAVEVRPAPAEPAPALSKPAAPALALAADDAKSIRLAKSAAFVSWQGKHEDRVFAKLLPILAAERDAIIKRVEKHVPKALSLIAGCRDKKHARQVLAASPDLKKILDMDEFAEAYKKITSELVGIYTEAGKNAAKEFGIAFKVDARGITKIGNHLEKSTDSILQTTAEQLRATLEEGFLEGEGVEELANRIRDTYEGISAGRARVIARTETVAPANDGAMQGYKQAGADKEWIATSDEATRDTHAALDGKVIPVDAEFVVGNDRMLYPGGGKLAEEVVNCRCTIGGVVRKGADE